MVQIRAEEARVTLEVVDDGMGCDLDTIDERSGLGLISMRERAEELGGVFAILSAPGEGMAIRVEINNQQEVP
jgi:signal transduction histidine kinase